MARTRARSCTEKDSLSQKDAWSRYYALKRKGASMIHVYACKFCKKYHVGHVGKPRHHR